MMTEVEWLASDDPLAMLGFIREKASDRKLRLAAAACCRRFWHMMGERSSPRAVEVAEHFADGEIDLPGLQRARSRLLPRPRASHLAEDPERMLAALLDDHAGLATDSTAWALMHFRYVYPASPQVKVERDAERKRLVRLYADLFGNPVRPPAPLPPSLRVWNDGVILNLALSAYDDRDLPGGQLRPDRLAVLADALEEAGHSDAALLQHLRSPGPHVRGCFALDAVLGRA